LSAAACCRFLPAGLLAASGKGFQVLPAGKPASGKRQQAAALKSCAGCGPAHLEAKFYANVAYS